MKYLLVMIVAFGVGWVAALSLCGIRIRQLVGDMAQEREEYLLTVQELSEKNHGLEQSRLEIRDKMIGCRKQYRELELVLETERRALHACQELLIEKTAKPEKPEKPAEKGVCPCGCGKVGCKCGCKKN